MQDIVSLLGLLMSLIGPVKRLGTRRFSGANTIWATHWVFYMY